MVKKSKLGFYVILSMLISSAISLMFIPTLQSINVGGLTLEVASSSSTCAAGSFVTQISETALGILTTTCTLSAAEAVSTPAACTAGNFLTRVTEAADGSLTFTCVAEGANEVASSPTACGAGNFLTRVTEAADGSLTFTCVADAAEAASSPTACAAGNFLTRVTEAADGSLTFTCVAEGANEADSSPAACSGTQFLTRVVETGGAIILTCGPQLVTSVFGRTGDIVAATGDYLCTQVTNCNVWTQITSFPAGCAAGSFVSIIAAIPTCTNFVSHIDSNVPYSTTSPTLVQNTFATFTTGTSGSKAFASNIATTNTIVVCETQQGTTVLPLAPTDTLLDSYTSITSSAVASSASAVQCWKTPVDGGGANTVTSGTYGATCSGTTTCGLFIFEVSGTDALMMITGTSGGTATASTSLATASISFTNTPLLLGIYSKATAGTDTAGTNFALANGETGSLVYLTEKSTSLTSTSTTCPATVGTSTTYNGICIVILKATTAFSVSLNANTNYVFSAYMSFGVTTGTTARMWIHKFTSGVTLQQVCMIGTQNSVTNNACKSITDSDLYVIDGSAAQSVELFGTVKVGVNAATLLIEFGSVQTATNNAQTLQAGSFITVTPTQ